MKYFVVNRGDALSLQLSEQFRHQAEHRGLIWDEQEPELVLSIGGDGTLLQAFHQFVEQLEHISFVGVHTGRLGFFADWKPEEIDHLVEVISAPPEESALRIVRYPLVEIIITTKSGEIETKLALNEFTIKGADATLVAQLNINDEMFEMFRGDGICISSPSGSTAYNKSLNGALIHPSIESIQIAEIASINNRVFRTLGSSMVLPKHHHCDIYPKSEHMLVLTLDHLSEQRNDVVSIRCHVSTQYNVRFARYRPFPFWDRVRTAFIGTDSQ